MITYIDNNRPFCYQPNSVSALWDTDADYPEGDFSRVFFRIQAADYEPYRGFATDAEYKVFETEAVGILAEFGYTETTIKVCSAACPTLFCGKAHLYVHPMNISGEVQKRDIVKIAEALNSANGFSCYTVDVYDTVYNMDDAEYTAYLERNRQKIEEILLQAAQTKRRNLYKDAGELVRYAASRIAIRRLGKKWEAELGWYGFTANFCNNVMRTLIDTGYLVSARKDDKFLIRTINKTEQRQRHLVIPSAAAV